MYLCAVPKADVPADLTSTAPPIQLIYVARSTWENPGLPHGRLCAVSRSLVGLLMLGACGGSGAAAQKPVAPPVATDRFAVAPPLVTPGEHMGYKLTLMGAELATFDLTVGQQETVAGKPTIVVQTHAKVSGIGELAASAAGIHVDDTFTSWIDLATGRPLRWYCDEFATKSEDKERTEAKLAERTGNTVPVEFHVNDNPPTSEPQTVSMPDVWDFNSFLVALRTWEAPPGSTVKGEAFRSRYIWHVEMTMGGKSRMSTALGEFPVWEVKGHTYKLSRDGTKKNDDERDFDIWFSDDAGRVPLKVVAKTDYGDVEMTIVDYNPGTGKD